MASAPIHANISNDSIHVAMGGSDLVYVKHEFLNSHPQIVVPCIVILAVASLVGTAGNILILLAVARTKELRNVESFFIVNLACSDLYVTLIADPMNIVAKLEGEPFFNSIPGLCQIVGSICTISCVGSLMSIGALSLNRYVHICHSEAYPKIYTRRNSIAICVGLYFIGLGLVLINISGIGAHTFDRRAVQCIWDRMATFPYTVVFSVVLVWIPLVLIGICFCRMYSYVSNNRRKIEQQTSVLTRKIISRNRRTRHHLAKALFIIYVVFGLCWLPYALLIVIDRHDNFPHEIHVYITTFAHLHPSLNWLVYYSTNRKFEIAFKKILHCGKCLTLDIDSALSGNENSNANNNKTIRFLELRRLSLHPAKAERTYDFTPPLERHTVT